MVTPQCPTTKYHRIPKIKTCIVLTSNALIRKWSDITTHHITTIVIIHHFNSIVFNVVLFFISIEAKLMIAWRPPWKHFVQKRDMSTGAGYVHESAAFYLIKKFNFSFHLCREWTKVWSMEHSAIPPKHPWNSPELLKPARRCYFSFSFRKSTRTRVKRARENEWGARGRGSTPPAIDINKSPRCLFS